MLHDMPVDLVPGTAGLVPGLVAVSSPPNSVATAATSLVPTISSKHSTCAISVAMLGNAAKQDGGCLCECTEKTGHFKKSQRLTRTLDARCPDVKVVHKNSLCFMERIIF